MAAESGFRFKIPEAVTKYLKADAPKDARLMAAKGMVPMAPAVLAASLTFLLQDGDEEVRNAAKESLIEMPSSMVQGIVKDQAHPKTFDYFARERLKDEKIIELILLNPITTDDTCVFLADKISERQSTLLANNQVRLLRRPEIAETLKKNTQALKSVLDTMVSFLRINGVVIEGESAELTHDEIKQILEAPEPEAQVSIPKVLTEEAEGDAPVAEEKKKSIYQAIMTMTVAQKVKLALLGNKEARGLLIKDSNKVVSTSVIKSPRITDGEVIAIANMRTAQDEIIRIIANNPDWTKHYTIQTALASNPKTPVPVALKIVRNLRVPELLKLSKNKNIAGQVSKIAAEMYERKRK